MTKSIKLYQVDAFTDSLFKGNPAAVCPLEEWLPDELMQTIAAENNLAETAFYVKKGDEFEIRWFTPTVEVPLCGHATLASAFVEFFVHQNPKDTLVFQAQIDQLTVTRKEEVITLNFPVDTITSIPLTEELITPFSIPPIKAYKGREKVMLVFSQESEIQDLDADLNKVAKIEAGGVIVTAKGDAVDFVSRFFAPQSGIDEDPVTGSAHTTLTPYWANELGKTVLKAKQLSPRGGALDCELKGDRVYISGTGVLYLQGEITVPG